MSKFIGMLLLASCVTSIPPFGPLGRYREVKIAAHEAWLEAGVETTTTYSLDYLSAEALEIECGLSHIDGCSHLESSEIYIETGLPPERQLVVLMHEVGHITRGKLGHLECLDHPGDDVMCPSACQSGCRPTKRDISFITE